jgi:ribosomal silencing factor RsfS
MQRVVIYPKDIMIVTGRSERYSRNLLKKIKANFNKAYHQPLTIEEFCQYMGFDSSQIRTNLK